MKKKQIFSEDELRSIAELGFVLRKIRSRLLAEGKIKIDKNGKTVFLGIEKKSKK